MARTWKLGHERLTATQIEDRLRLIKDLHKNYQQIAVAEDEQFLLYYFRLHPDWYVRVGGNEEHLLYFFVARPPDQKKGRCFWVRRRDGADVHFGAKKTRKGWGDRTAAAFTALRCEVEPQVSKFMADTLNAGPVFDPYSGAQITWTNCHVDHKAPQTFIVLAKTWLAENDIEAAEIATTICKTKRYIRDQNLAAAWRDYHQRSAVLRLLTERSSLSDAKKDKGASA